MFVAEALFWGSVVACGPLSLFFMGIQGIMVGLGWICVFKKWGNNTGLVACAGSVFASRRPIGNR